MPLILPDAGGAVRMPVKAPKNTEKRYRFFTIDRLVKAGGAVYNEKNFDI